MGKKNKKKVFEECKNKGRKRRNMEILFSWKKIKHLHKRSSLTFFSALEYMMLTTDKTIRQEPQPTTNFLTFFT